MRTQFAVVLGLSLAAGVLVVQMAGFGAVTGEPPAAGMDAGDTLEEEANDSVANSGLQGDARSSDGDLVGVIISGVQVGFSALVAFTAKLPWTLNNLGIPWYGAYPAGLFVQVVMGIGLIQWATNRPYR